MRYSLPFFVTKSVSMHTGMAYSASESFGFASISSTNDHKAEAIHAALQPIMKWVDGWWRVTQPIVSDSTVAQYRNKLEHEESKKKHCYFRDLIKFISIKHLFFTL